MGGCFSYLFFAVFSTLGMYYFCNLIFSFNQKRNGQKSSILGSLRRRKMEKVLGDSKESLELKTCGNTDLRGGVYFLSLVCDRNNICLMHE